MSRADKALPWACPEWDVPIAEQLHDTGIWQFPPMRPGYGQNLRIKSGDPGVSEWGIAWPWSNTSWVASPGILENPIRLDDLTHTSRRILNGDSVRMWLTVNPGTGQWQKPHAVWPYYHDSHPDRHVGAANYLMVDGHAASLSIEQSQRNARNPRQ